MIIWSWNVFLSKPSVLVKNKVVGKFVYDELANIIKNFQAIGNNDLVKKANCGTKVEDIKNKVPNYDKYVSANDFNELTKQHIPKRLKQETLISDHFFKIQYVEK